MVVWGSTSRKIYRSEFMMSPSLWWLPSIVYVLPEVVCPYMKMVELLPFRNYWTTWEQHWL